MPKEKEDQPIDLKQEQYMMENGLGDSVMDLVFKNGQTVLVMKVNGEITELMVRVNLLTLMVIFTRDNG